MNKRLDDKVWGQVGCKMWDQMAWQVRYQVRNNIYKREFYE